MNFELQDKLEKLKNKSIHNCYKLVWQWAKEKSITLSTFELLCQEISKKSINNAIAFGYYCKKNVSLELIQNAFNKKMETK